MDRREAVRNAYRKTLLAAPPTTAVVIKPLIQAADKEQVPANPKDRAAWLAALSDHDDEQGGLVERRDQLLRLWKGQGVWVHPQGNLEHVLGLPPEGKGREATTAAANESGPLDAVADWVAYQLDTASSTFELLSAAVRDWATKIQLQVRKNDAFRLSGTHPPTGARPLLRVEPLGPGRHRITVTGLDDFNDYWMEFTPELAVASMKLQPPVAPAD